MPPGYRDRAKERREGVDTEYAETERILSALTSSNAAEGPMPPPPPSTIRGAAAGDATATMLLVDPNVEADPQMDSFKSLSEDQSKYLGGDIEHTHLVKGLDYTLLEKVRTDIGRNDPDA